MRDLKKEYKEIKWSYYKYLFAVIFVFLSGTIIYFLTFSNKNSIIVLLTSLIVSCFLFITVEERRDRLLIVELQLNSLRKEEEKKEILELLYQD